MRRAAWSSEPIGTAEFDDWSEPAGAIVDSEPPSAPPVTTPPFDAGGPVAKPAKPALQLRIPADAVRSASGPLIRGLRQVAPAAALLAVMIGAAWMARPYVGKVKTWLTELTATASPQPAPVFLAKSTPPSGARRATGLLVARSDPAGARVLVDGRDRGVTPLTLKDLALGSHTVVIRGDNGSVKRTVTVSPDRTALVSESIFAGWLNVYAPFEIQISEGSRAIRLDEKSRVLLPPGSHDLRFENRDLGYQETRTIEVGPGQTTSLSLVPPPSMLNVTSNVPAAVLIDGERVGDTPLTNQPIALGTREVIVKSADGAERRFTKKVTVTPVQIDIDFSKP